MSFLDDLAADKEDQAPAKPEKKQIARLTSTKESLAQREEAHEKLKRLEDEMLQKSMSVVNEAMAFGDIPFGLDEPPEEWVEELGYEEACRKLRYTIAGQLSQKTAPVGVRVAKDIAIGILRARATEKARPVMNVQLVQLSSAPEAPAQYKVREVEIEDD